MFGTRIAETILASVHVRARKQAGHMDASDLIRALPKYPCEEGAVHIWKADIRSSRLNDASAPAICSLEAAGGAQQLAKNFISA